MVRRRFKTAVLCLVVLAKLVGGVLIGFAPAAPAVADSHHHCDPAAMDHPGMDHASMGDAPMQSAANAEGLGSTDENMRSPSGSTAHSKHCSNGCQCGCLHAPAGLFAPITFRVASGHAPAAHGSNPLTLQVRYDVVFKPPI